MGRKTPHFEVLRTLLFKNVDGNSLILLLPVMYLKRFFIRMMCKVPWKKQKTNVLLKTLHGNG
jgi:hypothetical protein